MSCSSDQAGDNRRSSRTLRPPQSASSCAGESGGNPPAARPGTGSSIQNRRVRLEAPSEAAPPRSASAGGERRGAGGRPRRTPAAAARTPTARTTDNARCSHTSPAVAFLGRFVRLLLRRTPYVPATPGTRTARGSARYPIFRYWPTASTVSSMRPAVRVPVDQHRLARRAAEQLVDGPVRRSCPGCPTTRCPRRRWPSS